MMSFCKVLIDEMSTSMYGRCYRRIVLAAYTGSRAAEIYIIQSKELEQDWILWMLRVKHLANSK
jgi:hypothetical protein